MSNPAFVSAASSARQRLAGSLGALQADGNIPAPVLEIASGLARAIGPLFQLERGSTDGQLFVTARAALQDTLEKMQTVDQGNPAVADATSAIAEALKTLFVVMRDHGLLGAPAAAPAAAPAPPPAPPPAPIAKPVSKAGAKSAPALSPTPDDKPASGLGSVPVGPSGLPRLEAELGVYSETNFYTDFLMDVRNHGGIFVATFATLPVGSKCEVGLTFPGNLACEIQGVVRWKRENTDLSSTDKTVPGLGVEIMQANREAWGLIERYVKKRTPIVHEM